jgi:hypothetical protein
MPKTPGKQKRRGLGLETFRGTNGQNYLIFRTPTGSYHAFVEIEAKQAARDCGAKKESTTHQMWGDLWRG